MLCLQSHRYFNKSITSCMSTEYIADKLIAI